jgi:hypothetical protein
VAVGWAGRHLPADDPDRRESERLYGAVKAAAIANWMN